MTSTAQILDFPPLANGRSCGEKPNVPRRKYLSPDEARRVIDAAGRVGRQRERDQLLLTMMYRHGLRVGEAVDLRWTDLISTRREIAHSGFDGLRAARPRRTRWSPILCGF
jgi:integrase